MPRFSLTDDGSLDTVIMDNLTGEEHRFNYVHATDDGEYHDRQYDEFVNDCIAELEAEAGITQ